MNRSEQERIVALARDPAAAPYPAAPFSPPEAYPELRRGPGIGTINPQNHVYPLVRRVLERLGLDSEHRGTPEWNPFRSLVKPGQKVVIKPNLVFHDHPLGEEGTLSMITHASVIRPIMDYVLLATEGRADITVCDAPLQSADFALLVNRNGLDALVSWYRSLGVNVRLVDLRREIAVLDDEGLIVQRVEGSQDPKGFTTVDLGKRSAFYPIQNQAGRLEITDYPPGSVARHHGRDRNEYLIGTSVLDSDLFINVPKLKTHKKAGITGAMKNLIGINGDKSWIAHHRRGGPRAGGDEYDVFRPWNYAVWHLNAALKRSGPGLVVNRWLRKAYRHVAYRGRAHRHAVMEGAGPRVILEGSWIGNDTLWRTIVDLNHVVLFADRIGRLHEEPQRRYLAIADAIIAGEKNGPMEQKPRPTGMILGALNPVALDCVAAAVMGFDPHRLPQIRHGLENEFFPLCPVQAPEIELQDGGDLILWGPEPFAPPVGWEEMVVAPGVPIRERIAGERAAGSAAR